jgi:hypothetical protein
MVLAATVSDGIVAQLLPPPVTGKMKRTLQHTGLALEERIVWRHLSVAHASTGENELRPGISMQYSNTSAAVLFSGSARSCDVREYAAYLMAPCVSGRVSMLFLINGRNGSAGKSDTKFESNLRLTQCFSNLISIANNTQCDIVVGEMRFELVARPCGGLNIPDRLQMMMLGMGRVYEWATSLLPPVAFYVRARLDDMAYCVPPVKFHHDVPSSFSRNFASSDVIVFNYYRLLVNSKLKLMAFHYSDRYALVPKKLASAFFGVWDMWSNGVDCGHPCFGGTHDAPLYTLEPRGSSRTISPEICFSEQLSLHEHKFIPAMLIDGDYLVRRVDNARADVTLYYRKTLKNLKFSDVVKIRSGWDRRCTVSPSPLQILEASPARRTWAFSNGSDNPVQRTLE